MAVSSGGVFKDLVLQGENLFVSGGDVASRITCRDSGYLHVLDNGEASGTIVNGGGLFVSGGGRAEQTTVSDGQMNIFDGGSGNGVTVSGGSLIVCGVATAIDLKDGRMNVSGGGEANGILFSGGSIRVADGGTANDITFLGGMGGNHIHVSSGGTVNLAAVQNGGYLLVFDGGVTTGLTVAGAGAYIHVSSGGTANATTINNNASLTISSGAAADEAVVNNGGKMNVSGGGSGNAVTVNKNGLLVVAGGAEVTAIRENGGFVNVSSGANVTFVANSFSGVILSDNSATVHSGTTATAITLNVGGFLYVYDGGTVSGASINSAGFLFVSAGTAENAVVNSYGRLNLHSGATANDAVVKSGGVMGVYSSSTANDAVVEFGGRLDVYGTACRAAVSSGGRMIVYSTGAADSAVVESGGRLEVSRGVADDATVSSGGLMIVGSSGTANDAVIESEGRLEVSRGLANGTTVGSGGVMVVYNSGTASDSVIEFSGFLDLSSGGAAGATTVNEGGSMFIADGGRHTGALWIAEGAVVSAYAGSVIDFDISAAEPDEAALINDLSLIQGAPDFVLTVSAFMSAGTYVLAEGAEDFDQTITVRTADSVCGTVTVANSITVAGQECTLELEDGMLTLTVDAAPPSKPVVSADITAKTGRSVTVSAEFDEVSAIREYSFDLDEWFDYTGGIAMASNGTVYFRAQNVDGEYSEIASYTVSNITASMLPPGKVVADTLGYNKNYTDKFTAELAFSGIYKLAASLGKLNGTLTVKTGSTTVASATITKGVLKFKVGSTKLLLDKAKTYTITLTNSDKGKSKSAYTLSLKTQTLFDHPDRSGADNWSDLKTKGAASAKYGKLGTLTSAGALIPDGWVGYGDSIDYKSFTLASAAKLSFTVTTSDAAKFTVYSLVKTTKKGKTTYSLKALQSKTFAAGTTASTAGLLLKKGTYYLAVQSTTAAKGGDAYYSLALRGTSEFYTAISTDDNAWATAPKVESGDSFSGWVGFSDATDYREFTGVAKTGGLYKFTLTGATNKVKLTVYEVQTTKVKGKTKTSLKALKSVTATSSASTGNLALAAKKRYIVAVTAVDAAKGRNSSYTLTTSQTGVFTGTGNNTLAKATKLVASEEPLHGMLSKVSGGDTVDFYDLASVKGQSLNLTMDSGTLKVTFCDKKGKAIKVSSLTMANAGVKKNVSSLTLTNGNTVTDSITFTASASNLRYLKIEATKSGVNAYSLAVPAVA